MVAEQRIANVGVRMKPSEVEALPRASFEECTTNSSLLCRLSLEYLGHQEKWDE